MWLLSQASKIISSPLGSLIYHLLLLLAVEAALAMAWGEWRRARREQARRLYLAMAGLIVVRVPYIVAALLASAGWADAAIFPPLERFADTASVGLLGWAFMPPLKDRVRTWDLVFGANLLAAIAACVVFAILWSGNPQGDYNASWQAIVWGVWQMGLIVLATVAVLRNRSEGWGTFLLAMAILFAGQLLQLVYPSPSVDIPAWERLANLVAYPLIAVAVYLDIVAGLRVHSRQLQDISQASMDQIKSLLFLFDASQQMSGSLDLDTVLENAVGGMARALGADQCAIAFPEEDNPGQMRLVSIYNPARQGRGEAVALPFEYQLTVQQAMRRKRYIIAEESDNVQLKVLFALMGSSEVGPLLVQPLLADGEAIGAIIVGNSRSRRPFTPNEAKLCQSMAEQLVVAIQNARQYQAAQEEIQGLDKAVAQERKLGDEAQARVRALDEQLEGIRLEMEDLRQREELTREARNALEIRLVSSRAEAEALSERVTVLETDLSQTHANAEAQARWHQEEVARQQVEWEVALQAAEWSQAVLQGMTAGVLFTDADGVIQESNVAAEILLDQDHEALQGLDLVALSEDERWQQAVASASEGEAVRLTMQMGSNTLMCDVAPLPDMDLLQGGVNGLVVILQDISAEIEDQRSHLQSIASMAEELRTPMTEVISYLDLLVGESGEPEQEAQQKLLTHIRAGTERMAQMSEDLARLAGGEELWASPQRREVDLNELIEATAAGSCVRLEDRGIALDLDLPGDLPAVEADPDYLRRVLSNLLSNACLASTRGGQVRVQSWQSNNVPFAEGRLELNGDRFVIVSVQDSGGGLSDEALTRIFDRGRPSQTPPGLGESGAGLALVKTLVESHGGRLWVESEQGVGTTFSFVLPVQDQGVAPPAGLEGNGQGKVFAG